MNTTHIEIKATYEELSVTDAFEAFDVAGVETGTVGAVLGAEVANDYASWIFYNMK